MKELDELSLREPLAMTRLNEVSQRKESAFRVKRISVCPRFTNNDGTALALH